MTYVHEAKIPFCQRTIVEIGFWPFYAPKIVVGLVQVEVYNGVYLQILVLTFDLQSSNSWFLTFDLQTVISPH